MAIEISERTDGNLTIDREVIVNGRVAGDVRVMAGGVLTMGSVTHGNVIVEDGGRAELHGVTEGDVINIGGDVAIYAAVRGCVRSERGSVFVARDIIARGAMTDAEHPDGKSFS